MAALFLCLLFLFDWFVCFFVCPIKCPCLILLFAVCMIVFRLFTVGLFAVSLLFVYFFFVCFARTQNWRTVWPHCFLCLFDCFVCFFVCPIKCPCLLLLFAVCMIVFRLFTVGLFAVSLLFVYFSFCLFCSSGLNTKLTVWSHCFLCLFDRFVCFFACTIKCPCLL